MTDHSTRRAAFLAAVRDAFDEHFPRPEDDELAELPEYAQIDAGSDMVVFLPGGDGLVISDNCSLTDLDRIVAACTAWAAIKRRETDDA